jgi:hypothetical protein
MRFPVNDRLLVGGIANKLNKRQIMKSAATLEGTATRIVFKKETKNAPACWIPGELLVN